MAIAGETRLHVNRLARFGLTTANADRMAAFYEDAFGCRRLSREERSSISVEEFMHVSGGALCLTLALGEQIIELLEFERPGRPYPQDLSPYDVHFQHLAIVVADMSQALMRLSTACGWTAISTAGPQTLPHRSGGVTAFKFRDPEGHPLELILFPKNHIPGYWRTQAAKGVFLGLDHSAMSIAEVRRSIEFYESWGFKALAQTLNEGVEQQRLDGVANPRVDVVALAPAEETPHVELLHYRGSSRPRSPVLQSNDIAAIRLIFLASSEGYPATPVERLIQDPDGHFLQIVTGRNSQAPTPPP